MTDFLYTVEIEKVTNQIAAIDEDIFIVETHRSWFWKIRRWLLCAERKRWQAQLEDLLLRRQWRAEKRRALISEEK